MKSDYKFSNVSKILLRVHSYFNFDAVNVGNLAEQDSCIIKEIYYA